MKDTSKKNHYGMMSYNGVISVKEYTGKQSWTPKFYVWTMQLTKTIGL